MEIPLFVSRLIGRFLDKLRLSLRRHVRVGRIVTQLASLDPSAVDFALSTQRVFNSDWLPAARSRFKRFFRERRLLSVLFRQEARVTLGHLGRALRVQKGEEAIFDGPFNSETVDATLVGFASKHLCRFGPVLPISESNGRYTVLSLDDRWRTDMILVSEILRNMPLTLLTPPSRRNIQIKICPQVLLEELVEMCAAT